MTSTTYTLTYTYFGKTMQLGPFATREQGLRARDRVMIQTLASEHYQITENAVKGGNENGLPRCGFVTFSTQELAEQYLRALPHPYCGSTRKLDYGWAVSFRKGGN